MTGRPNSWHLPWAYIWASHFRGFRPSPSALWFLEFGGSRAAWRQEHMAKATSWQRESRRRLQRAKGQGVLKELSTVTCLLNFPEPPKMLPSLGSSPNHEPFQKIVYKQFVMISNHIWTKQSNNKQTNKTSKPIILKYSYIVSINTFHLGWQWNPNTRPEQLSFDSSVRVVEGTPQTYSLLLCFWLSPPQGGKYFRTWPRDS